MTDDTGTKGLGRGEMRPMRPVFQKNPQRNVSLFPKQFTVGVLNATVDLAALVLVGVAAFLGSQVVLSPVVSRCLPLSPVVSRCLRLSRVGWCCGLLKNTGLHVPKASL